MTLPFVLLVALMKVVLFCCLAETVKNDLYVFNMPGMKALLARSAEKKCLMMMTDAKYKYSVLIRSL